MSLLSKNYINGILIGAGYSPQVNKNLLVEKPNRLYSVFCGEYLLSLRGYFKTLKMSESKTSHKEVTTMKTSIKLIVLSVSITLLFGCSGKQKWQPIEEDHKNFVADTGDTTEVSKRSVRSKSLMAPGYLLTIANTDDETMNGEYRIDFDGNLKLPYDVVINATGLSGEALTKKLKEAYQPFYRTNPQIQFTVKERKYWVDAQGLVKKPGTYLMKRDSTLDDLIVQAGGLNQSGTEGSEARFARLKDSDYSAVIRLTDYYSGVKDVNPTWHGGETVFFQSDGDDQPFYGTTRKDHVQVLGQVRRPGEFPYKMDGDFFYYLIQAGGPGDRADLQNVVIVRTEEGKKKSLQVDLENMRTLPSVQGGDIVMVHAQNPSSTERKTQMFGTVGNLLSNIATTVLVFFAL